MDPGTINAIFSLVGVIVGACCVWLGMWINECIRK